jgi:hypothetical protein
MSALPVPMDEASILREFDDHESRVVAEHRRMPCDVACGARATLYVRVLDKKVHSHLCDEHGAQAIAAYHAAGLNVEAQLLNERVFSINAHRDQKKEQVERLLEKLGTPLTDGGEDFPVYAHEEAELERCRHCNAALTDENTHPRLGCCVECQEIAYAEYKRYGRDDS